MIMTIQMKKKKKKKICRKASRTKASEREGSLPQQGQTG